MRLSPKPVDSDAVTDSLSTAPTESFSFEIAKRLTALMGDNGIPPYQQAGLLTQLCGLSPSQARRKLQGASWSFIEVMTVVRHFNASLDGLFPEVGTGAHASTDGLIRSDAAPTQQATLKLGKHAVACLVRLGAKVQVTALSAKGTLIAQQAGENWVVRLAETAVTPPSDTVQFLVGELVIRPPSQSPYHIAILDDDPVLSEGLADWLNEVGYSASSFVTGDALLSGDLATYDGFVIDYLLAGGETAHQVIATIRKQRPRAPIVLLTGKLRDGLVSETELTTTLRTTDVTFFEKPIRPAVLAAALQSGLDRQSQP